MFLTKKHHLNILRRLKQRLAGKCGEVCPSQISRNKGYPHGTWICRDCHTHFNFIRGIKKTKICPCYRKCNPEEIFLRLDELIEEIEEEINDYAV